MNDFEKNNFADFTASSAMKDIGFDEPCLGFYPSHEPHKITPYRFGGYDGDDFDLNNNTNYLEEEEVTTAPLHQQATDYFEKHHGIAFDIINNPDGTTVIILKDLKQKASYGGQFAPPLNIARIDGKSKPEAYNAAIINAAKIVKEKQND